MDSFKDIIERLNAIDESTTIEAKRGSGIDRSFLETVCSFSNEPGLGGGYILLGVERDETLLFSYYTVTGVKDPEKLSLEIATQCATSFNMPVRPEVVVVEATDTKKLALQIFVPELANVQKPLFFKNEGLPRGAYRRISSSDQRCTVDDLHIFYNREDSFDSAVVKNSTIDDISDEAIEYYKQLRQKVNNFAEELSYNF